MEVFMNVVITIGVASLVGGLIYIGRKLQILDGLKETVDKIKVNIKVIGDHLTENDPTFNVKELQHYSPLRLTTDGEKFIKSIGFDKVFLDHNADFFAYIDSESPKLKYDVELASVKAVYALNDKPYMDFLKIYFYNNPTRNMSNTAKTLGVYIRDEYLKLHSEIKQ